MIQDEKHPDGIWHTTRYDYKDYVIVVKSRRGSGMKAHVFKGDKIVFTRRYKWISIDNLLTACKAKIEELELGINKKGRKK